METPLKNPQYVKLLSAQVIALAGTGLSTIALALLAYDLAGGQAGQVLGTALALKMIAYVGIAPLVGGISHLLPRKTFLIGLDLGRAVMIGCLPFVSEIWHIYLLVFCLNAFSAGFTPTFQACIPDILEDEKAYTRALSYSRLAYDLENLLSPLFAVSLLLVLSYSDFFTLNAVAFLLSAFLVMLAVFPAPKLVEREKGLFKNLTFGIRAYLATPRLRGVLAFSMVVSLSGAMVIVNSVVFVRDYLGRTEQDLAFLLMASGVGSMLAAMALPRVLDRYSEKQVMGIGGLLLVGGLAVGGFVTSYEMAFPLWFVLGCGASMVQTPVGRLITKSASKGDRPAFFAAQFALSHGCWLFAYPFVGWVGSAIGIAAVFYILGGLAVIFLMIGLFAWPGHDHHELEHTHEPHDHEHPHYHDEHHQHDHEGWEGNEPHVHPHKHGRIRHRHSFVIDIHHEKWPR
ncbi:MAG: MFS transporter [Alphaproteobacteria bacterium]|nr:MFS transporter [Alphaproteobacteria bacterium]